MRRSLLILMIVLIATAMTVPAFASKPPKGTSRSALRPKAAPAIEGYDPVAKLRQQAGRQAPRRAGLGNIGGGASAEPPASAAAISAGSLSLLDLEADEEGETEEETVEVEETIEAGESAEEAPAGGPAEESDASLDARAVQDAE